MCLWQKSSKLSRISSGEDDLEKDGKEDDGSEGGDPDNIIQKTTDSKVGFINSCGLGGRLESKLPEVCSASKRGTSLTLHRTFSLIKR